MWLARRYLIFAGVVGLLVSLGFMVYMAAMSEQQAVVVAAEPISAYQKITSDMISVEQQPASAVLPTSESDPAKVVGHYTTRRWYPGEQILRDELIYPGTQAGGIVWQLTEDERAMAIPCGPDTAVGGAVLPGHLVDVFYFRESSVHGPATARLLLSGLRVLDIRDSSGAPWQAEDREQLSTAVVAVTTHQAEAISYAMSTGEVYLAVSPYHPEAAQQGEGVTGGNLFSYPYAVDPPGDVKDDEKRRDSDEHESWQR